MMDTMEQTKITPEEYKRLKAEVVDKIVVARVGLLLRHPFFGNMATRLQIQECDEWCPTAATDGRNLYYNVEFFSKLSNKEIEFVIAHEILHCVFDHMTRREDRDPQLHNIACDYIVNNTLVRDNIGEKPKDIQIFQDWKYDGWTSEAVYDDIYKKGKEAMEQLGKLLDEHIDWEKGDAPGGGNKDDKKKPGSKQPTYSKEELEKIKDEIKDSMLQAAQTAGAGNLPKEVERVIKQFTEPKMNLREVLQTQIQSVIKNENPFYNVILDNSPENEEPFDSTAAAVGLDSSLNNYNLSQNRRIISNQLDAKIDYYYLIGSKSNINFTLGSIISKQEFDSSFFQFLDNDISFNPTPTFNNGLINNDVNYNFTDLYLGVHYRFRTGKFTFTPGFSYHSYRNKNTQLNTIVNDNFLKLLPDFETRIQLKKGESLTFNYNMRNQFTDVTRLARGLVFNSFNSLQFGEPDLQNALSHNLSLLYRSFNLFNYTNVFARASYTKNIDQIRQLTDFESVIRTSTFFNSSFADENMNVFGRIQRTFGKVRASLNSSFNYSKINQFIQKIQSLNEGFTQTYTPGIRTNFLVAPNINIRYRYSITNNFQGDRQTKFITKSPSARFDAYILKKITIKSDYSYTLQKQVGGDSQSFQIWNASISYRKDKDSKWEYEAKGTNLLNIGSQVRNSANNISVFNASTFIQPRFITLRAVYKL